ncbi:Amt family ammonium transporter [Aeromicrobium panaciterrae]|uniref:Ammonium transporter n=1 Tax=Aeromicrobium panaciterrae TaxID=363861 RepID=A0ABU1UQI8_9ACTN|nr:ammonium transporter [Aeromicrobium panaciterrae]MDR7087444.1 Amt family ammonium transporter [Aeromicrobium panaciterrae]
MNAGDTAWMLASSALVLLMAPGLAFFYGGMVRAKSVLNMMMMSFIAMAIVPVAWFLYAYSLAFDDDVTGGLVGGLGHVGLNGITPETLTGTIPTYVFVVFQLTFAIVTVALVSGAVADRMKFVAWALFVPVWLTVVYAPVAHWVFAFDTEDAKGGWIANKLGALDFAGGTVVEISSGASALALALVVGKRVGWKRDPMRPHNLPSVLLGAGLLWFGWIGFNAGSALGANHLASLALINTVAAGAAAMLGWLAIEVLREGKGTSFGAASGLVAGLVAITPSCGSVSPMGALVVGAVAGGICAFAIGFKFKLGYDDSLDVVGVHLVGGLVGTLLIGLLASNAAIELLGFGQPGLFYGGGLDQLGKQVVAAAVVLVYAFTCTYVIATVIDRLIGLRIDEEHEITGIDQVEHLETAYDHAGSSTGGLG